MDREEPVEACLADRAFLTRVGGWRSVDRPTAQGDLTVRLIQDGEWREKDLFAGKSINLVVRVELSLEAVQVTKRFHDLLSIKDALHIDRLDIVPFCYAAVIEPEHRQIRFPAQQITEVDFDVRPYSPGPLPLRVHAMLASLIISTVAQLYQVLDR
jgi:hypothetical protein